jgi:hypothetical protein
MRLLTLPLLACAFYVTAKLAPLRDDFEQRIVRGAFATAGSALIALLICYEAPVLWRPVAFIAFAAILLEISRALPYRVLAWHTHILSACAALFAITTDAANVHRWHALPVESFSALAVAAGLYWLAKRFYSTEERYRATVRGALYLDRVRADGLGAVGTGAGAVGRGQLDCVRDCISAGVAQVALCAIGVAGQRGRDSGELAHAQFQLRPGPKNTGWRSACVS